MNSELPAARANGFVHSAPFLPETAAALSAMPYIPPRKSTASTGNAADFKLKPSPTAATDGFPSASPTNTSTIGPNQMSYSQLPSDLDPSRLPGHVAIILDGYSRWAKRRGLPKELGHLAGEKSLSDMVRRCSDWGIRALTVFAFSTENWGRPEAEVNFRMVMMGRLLVEKLDELHSQRAAVRFIGDLSRLNPDLQHKIETLQDTTRDNGGLRVCVSLNYCGRQDMVHACRRIAERVAAGEIQPDQIREAVFAEELGTSWLGPDLANPDLLIRTSGEQRLSNFLL